MEKKKIRGISFAVSYLLMAVIPMVACTFFFYPQIRKQIVDRTDDDAMRQVERGIEELDKQLQIINNIPNTLFLNEEINQSAMEYEPRKNLTISKEIKKTIVNNSLIEEAFLYARKDKYFFSGYQGNIPLDRLLEYGGVVGFLYEKGDLQEILEVLDSANGTFQRPAETVVLRGIVHDRIITFISTIPLNNKFAYAATMVMVDGDQLVGLFSGSGSAEGNGWFVFDANGQVIYCSAEITDFVQQQVCSHDLGEMIKEKTVRLEKTWLLNIKQSSTSGWTLVKVTNLQPMLQEIRESVTKTVWMMLVLSIVLGGLCYYFMVLNFFPIEQIAQQLKQTGSSRKRKMRNAYYDEMERAIKILQEDNSRMAGNLSRTKPRLKRHLFSELLSDSFIKGRDEDFLIELQSVGLAVENSNYRIALISFLQEDAVETILPEIPWEKDGFLYMYVIPGTINVIFLIGEREDENIGKRIFSEWKKKYDWFHEEKAGVGGRVNSILQISRSYSQACVALDCAIMDLDMENVAFYDELPDSLFSIHSYPLELIESLTFAVRMNKTDDTHQIMHQIESMIQMKKFSPYYIRSLFFIVVSVFMEKQEKIQDIGEKEDAVYRALTQPQSSAQMLAVLKELYQGFLKKVNSSEAREDEWVSQIKLYIHENYGESSLSLIEVAEHIGMSPTRFSSLFKEKSGCNFKEYVDLIRLEKARELLEDTELKVEMIAEMVGYNSGYSFARFFRKQMGMSPKEYRELKTI